MLYLLTGSLAALIAHKRGGPTLRVGVLGMFCPLLGLVAALATPPKDGLRLQEEPPPFWLQPGSDAQNWAAAMGGATQHRRTFAQGKYGRLARAEQGMPMATNFSERASCKHPGGCVRMKGGE